MWRRSLPLLACLLIGCVPATSDSTAATTSTVPSPTTTRTTVPLVPGCPDPGEFEEGGHVGRINQQLSDASTIGAISWDENDACETFTISFETSEGAPATTPPSVIVDYLDPAPIIRIRLDTDTTLITDQLVETALVDRLYVVRALDGGMFIDLHLGSPAQSRISIDTSPATFRIDLQPGIVDHPVGPAIAPLTVVIRPQQGGTASSPVEIVGYSRTFEANVMVIATAGGQVVARANTTAADYIDTWGEFRMEVEIPPGVVSMFVGDQSPEDGSLEGVTFSLSVP